MRGRKSTRGLIAGGLLVVTIVATLFCFLISLATCELFRPRLIGYQPDYYSWDFAILGYNFGISSLLSAALLFLVRKRLLSTGFHRVLVIIATFPIEVVIICDLPDFFKHIIDDSYSASWRIYSALFIASLILYIVPIICEYIYARRKYPIPGNMPAQTMPESPAEG